MPENKKTELSSLQKQQLPGIIVMPDAQAHINLGSGTITSLISSGGMALIYEIWNPELEVKRAIKILHPDHSKDSEERFQTEIKISAKLHHPNIVEIYAVGKWNNLPYIEMERINGQTLEKVIIDRGGLPVEVCTSIGIMVGRALNYAHNQNYQIYGKEYHGIIHRDLKPGNIMIADDGIVKLMDFGIAKPMAASTRTIEGVVMGTMQYLAPEQLDGHDIDVRADIYSLGTVIYETLTGKRAFPEQNLAKLVTDKLCNNYIPLEKSDRKIPSQLCGLVHKCLRYEKEKRIQSAIEFLKLLGNIHKTLTEKSPELILSQFMNEIKSGKAAVSVNKRSGKKSGIWIIAAILIIIASAASVIFLTGSKSGQKSTLMVESPPAQVSPAVPARLDTVQMHPKTELTVDSTDSSDISAKHIKDVFKPVYKPEIQRHTKVLDQPRKGREKNVTSEPKRRTKKISGKLPEKPYPQTASQKNIEADAPVIQTIQPPQEPAHPEPNIIINNLRQSYRTNDLMIIFSREVENGHFDDALVVYDSINRSDASTKKAIIYRLRALTGAGRKQEKIKLLLSNDIYDGEFYLEKAEYFMEQSQLVPAEDLLKKAAISPCRFSDSKQFRKKLMYDIAICASGIYDKYNSYDNKKKALDAWVEIKNNFKKSPEHPYFKKADSEIRRLNKS
jgi:hypothetical protein